MVKERQEWMILLIKLECKRNDYAVNVVKYKIFSPQYLPMVTIDMTLRHGLVESLF